MPDAVKLENCPFCGSAGIEGWEPYLIKCSNRKCHLGNLPPEKQFLRVDWQTRTPSTTASNEGELEILRGLVTELTDSGDCYYDYHGYCQAHSLHSAPCPHERAKALAATPTPPSASTEGIAALEAERARLREALIQQMQLIQAQTNADEWPGSKAARQALNPTSEAEL